MLSRGSENLVAKDTVSLFWHHPGMNLWSTVKRINKMGALAVCL